MIWCVEAIHSHTYTYVTCPNVNGTCEQSPVNHLPDHQRCSHYDNLMLAWPVSPKNKKFLLRFKSDLLVSEFSQISTFYEIEITNEKTGQFENAILDHKLLWILFNR